MDENQEAKVAPLHSVVEEVWWRLRNGELGKGVFGWLESFRTNGEEKEGAMKKPVVYRCEDHNYPYPCYLCEPPPRQIPLWLGLIIFAVFGAIIILPLAWKLGLL
jgi:hypothetical protein